MLDEYKINFEHRKGMLTNFLSKLKSIPLSSRVWILLILLVTSSLAILTISKSVGIVWPDEIFQTLEPAYYLYTQIGQLPWEFTEKARSTLYPYILSGWVRLIYSVSAEPTSLYFSTRCMLALIFIFMITSATRYFFEYNKNTNYVIQSFLIFLIVYILFPLNYYFGFRTLTESITTSIALLAIFGLANESAKKTGYLFFWGFLLGLTYGIRFQMGVFLMIYVPLLCVQFWKENNKKSLSPLLIGIFLGFVLYPLSDYFFYGTPFISSYNYFAFTILKQGGNHWGTLPIYYYLESYIQYFNLLLLFLIPGLVVHFRKLYPLIFATLFFIIIHSLIAHKELRFIYITFPILLFFISSGMLYSFQWITSKTSKANIILTCILLLTLFFYKNTASKNILWNLGKENLQLYLTATKSGVQGNSLIAISDTFTLGAGYVYMGPQFDGDLYFYDMYQLSEIKRSEVLLTHNIKNILTFSLTNELYCKKYGFCRNLVTIGPYSWISK